MRGAVCQQIANEPEHVRHDADQFAEPYIARAKDPQQRHEQDPGTDQAHGDPDDRVDVQGSPPSRAGTAGCSSASTRPGGKATMPPMMKNSIRATETRDGALIEDLAFDGPDGLEVEAYLVRSGAGAGNPAAPRAAAGILMWHWLDTEAPDGNRTQFVDEAVGLARAGAVCLLPQGRFPWTEPPTGAAVDRVAIEAEVARVRAGLDLLAARPDVDSTRLAVVGHDFGGMLAAVAAADDDRLRALVIIAATPRLGRLVPSVLGYRRGPHRLPAGDALARPHRGHRELRSGAGPLPVGPERISISPR